jgi:hypothetical protein
VRTYKFANATQVFDKLPIRLLFGGPVRHAQQIRRMNRDEAGVAIEIRPASEFLDRKRFASERQDGCCAERDHELWMYKLQLLVQPPSIVLDLSRRRLLVDTPFSTLLELECLMALVT